MVNGSGLTTLCSLLDIVPGTIVIFKIDECMEVASGAVIIYSIDLIVDFVRAAICDPGGIYRN